MENSANVISAAQRAANLKRSFWSFRYPHQVVSDADLNLEEKRAILSAWASDEHTVESLPTLRHLPGTPFPVTFSSIMAARVALDKMTDAYEQASSLPPTAINAPVQADFGRGRRNNIIMALDRTGNLQTARWRDRPMARPNTMD